MTFGFERLDRRMVMLAAVVGLATAVLTAIIMTVVTAVGDAPRLLIALLPLAVLAVSVGGEYLRWRATTYRVTDDRLELSYRLVVSKQRSLSRDRIRTVDVTAGVIQRVFGLAKVVVGTGQHGSSGTAEITLDPVSRERADQLRRELLHRGKAAEEVPAGDGAIATLSWGWARYAPLSFLTPALGAAALGALFNVSGWLSPGIDTPEALVEDLLRLAALFGYFTLVAGVAMVGAVGALLLFVEMWWSYRLEREPGGTLRVRRGLLTRRSVSLEERRLRGVEVVEPIGIRMVKAARVDAVATGLRSAGGGDRTDHKTLLPAAPRAVADRVAAEVLAEEVSPVTAARLRRHPVAAKGRRLRWALMLVAPLAVAVAVLELALGERRGTAWFVEDMLNLAWLVAAGAIPVAAAIAIDAYRNLGHGLSGRYLVARSGAARRGTVALQRSGVIGWTVRQSIFQRRVGLLTLEATTSAGRGAYAIPDVDPSDGLRFADAAVPGLIEPFLESR